LASFFFLCLIPSGKLPSSCTKLIKGGTTDQRQIKSTFAFLIHWTNGDLGGDRRMRTGLRMPRSRQQANVQLGQSFLSSCLI